MADRDPLEVALEWLRDPHVERVEVLQGNPDTSVWRVWLSEGAGHGWAGHAIATCSNEFDAALIKHAIEKLKEAI